MSTDDLAVGSTVWVFDHNHRVYPERKPGEAYSGGASIFREYFRPREIIAETRLSWVLNDGRKVNKKTLGGIWTSIAAVDEACWVEANTMRISNDVRHCSDIGVLRQIDALLKGAK